MADIIQNFKDGSVKQREIESEAAWLILNIEGEGEDHRGRLGLLVFLATNLSPWALRTVGPAGGSGPREARLPHVHGTWSPCAA